MLSHPLRKSWISSSHLGALRHYSKAKLPALPYGLGELEPVLNGSVLEVHYTKHHATYVNTYNTTLEEYEEAKQKQNTDKLMSLHNKLEFNYGGHLNHSIYWENLTPKKMYEEPKGKIREMIQKEYGSLETFQQEFTQKTVAVQGSGWGLLGYDPTKKRLQYTTVLNQQPFTLTGLKPLLAVDVWEHAYYLQYKNLRLDYLKKIWEIINWEVVEKRLQNAKK